MNDLYSTGNSIVDSIGKIHLEGNVTPHAWYQTIKYPNGKAHLLAISILSDVVYWYRPTVVRDEMTGQITATKKKFKADLLQRNYDQLAEYFGVTKRQAQDAVIFLEKLGVIKRHLRTISTDSGKIPNVLFLELSPFGLRELTYPKTTKNVDTVGNGDISHVITGDLPHYNVRPSHVITGDLSRYNGTPPTLKRGTNTEITTEITTEISTESIYRDPTPKKTPKKVDDPKTNYAEFVTLTEKQYLTLVEKYGQKQTDGMIVMLDNYKGSSGKQYKSDYHAILSWVADKYTETNKANQPGNKPLPRAYQSMLDWEAEQNES